MGRSLGFGLDVSVQMVSVTLPNGTATATASFSAVDVTRAFPVYNGVRVAGSSPDAGNLVRLLTFASTYIVVDSGKGAGISCIATFAIVHFGA